MRAAIVTFDGYNELDSFVALALLNRAAGWRAEIVSDRQRVVSMNGVGIDTAQRIEALPHYDVVLIGSGVRTQAVAADAALMARIRLDPARQIIGAQCSGALLLARLGLLDDMPVCTDTTSRPFVEAAEIGRAHV